MLGSWKKGLQCALASALAVPIMAGCGCLSSQQVREREMERLAANRMTAVPAMAAAARERGAALLPVQPEEVHHRLPCVNGRDDLLPDFVASSHDACVFMQRDMRGCQEPFERGTFVIRHKGENPKMVIPMRHNDGWQYARLAQRGNKLFIMRPELTIEESGSVTECTCDGMPRVVCPLSLGFVLNEIIPNIEIEEVSVPIMVEEMQVKCKAIGL